MTINNWGSASVIAEAGGGLGQSSYASGDMIYASGTNTLSKLAAGTNDDVLTVSGGIPAWVSPAVGDWRPLAKTTASASSSIDFNSSLVTSSYGSYALLIENLQPSSDADILIRLSPDNGTTVRSTGYVSGAFRFGTNSEYSETTGMNLNAEDVGSATGEGQMISWVTLADVSSASIKTVAMGWSSYIDSTGNQYSGANFSMYDTAEAHNFIRIVPTAGNLSTGTVYLMGMTTS